MHFEREVEKVVHSIHGVFLSHMLGMSVWRAPRHYSLRLSLYRRTTHTFNSQRTLLTTGCEWEGRCRMYAVRTPPAHSHPPPYTGYTARGRRVGPACIHTHTHSSYLPPPGTSYCVLYYLVLSCLSRDAVMVLALRHVRFHV